ncbi:uncharacterized protein [Littorina saxatilis]|uniref:Uncharacterized protein n=1 Tax=Littorina saxatilis TaxID=31220 RepID=A0AAN9G0V9_9CAEN
MARDMSIVVAVVMMMVMTTTTTLGLKCQKTGLCSCKAENGTIDLSPLAVNGSARFKDQPGPDAPYVYSWNPCIPFTEGGSCNEVAVCLKNNDTNDYYNLGFPSSANFFTWPDDGRLSLQYMVGGGDGNIKVSSIDLVCNPREEGKLEAHGKTSVGFYSFQLTSRYACVR